MKIFIAGFLISKVKDENRSTSLIGMMFTNS